jgi:hypothetical protein
MQQHTHKAAAAKSADSILDEFLLGQQQPPPSGNNHYKLFKRPPQDALTDLKKPPAPAPGGQRQQNLLFSISSARHDSYRRHSAGSADGSAAAELAAAANNHSTSIVHLQRKLIGFFFVYATIIIALYLTYAVYSYYQQSQLKRQQMLLMESSSQLAAGITPASSLVGSNAAELNSGDQQSEQEQASQAAATLKLVQELKAKLEDEINFLKRHLEIMQLDHEDTKARLSEREKCACSIGCSFNGTRFSDGQRWQQKCDTCTCRAGKISCVPQECPKPDCDDPVQLPGRCCPSCMKKCKLNKSLVRHGHSFRPNDASGQPLDKQCKCLDGLIKCEPIAGSKPAAAGALRLAKFGPATIPVAAAKNKTLEYLKSILGSPNRLPPQSADGGHRETTQQQRQRSSVGDSD